MKSLPRISKILKIDPFKVTLLWNNTEVRETDFTMWFKKWEQENNVDLLRLKDYNSFKQVSLSEQKTLQWANLPVEVTFKGQTQSFPLELDPDVLYHSPLFKNPTFPVSTS